MPVLLGDASDNALYQAWLQGDVNTPSAPVTIIYGNPQAGCNGAPGNWSILNYAGLANVGDSTIRQWLLDGYGQFVDADTWVSGNTGVFRPSFNTELTDLMTSGLVFDIPTFTAVTGNGTNAQFFIPGFVGVKLLDFKTNGPEVQRYLTGPLKEAP